jgi:hypothetical protein
VAVTPRMMIANIMANHFKMPPCWFFISTNNPDSINY